MGGTGGTCIGVMERILLISLILLCSACMTRGGPGAKRLPETAVTYQGVRAAAPDMPDGAKRLDLFLGVLPETDERERLDAEPVFEKVIYCVAINPEKDPLPEVARLIEAAPADKLIFVYGKPVTEKLGFWWDGVDCTAIAVGVWHAKARKYVYFDLVYGRPVWQWRYIRAALSNAVEKAANKAVDIANPLD